MRPRPWVRFWVPSPTSAQGGLGLVLKTLLAAPAVASHFFLKPGWHPSEKEVLRKTRCVRGNSLRTISWLLKEQSSVLLRHLLLFPCGEGLRISLQLTFSLVVVRPQWKTDESIQKITCVRSTCLPALTHRQEDFLLQVISYLSVMGLITLMFEENCGIMESFGQKNLLESFCLTVISQHDSS